MNNHDEDAHLEEVQKTTQTAEKKQEPILQEESSETPRKPMKFSEMLQNLYGPIPEQPEAQLTDIVGYPQERYGSVREEAMREVEEFMEMSRENKTKEEETGS